MKEHYHSILTLITRKVYLNTRVIIKMSTMATKGLIDNYTPNWLASFDSDGALLANVSAHVQCHICNIRYLAISHSATLRVDGEIPADKRGGETNEQQGGRMMDVLEDDEEYETFAILPCGHAFGYTCIQTWFATTARPDCPFCRKAMRHSTCGHVVDVQPIIFGDGANIHNVLVLAPLLHNEELPPLCPRCTENRAEQAPGEARQFHRRRRSAFERDGPYPGVWPPYIYNSTWVYFSLYT
jgi:hypothetical protein